MFQMLFKHGNGFKLDDSTVSLCVAVATVLLGTAWAFGVLRAWSTRWPRNMPLFARVVALLPTFAAFAASPLFFERDSQPFWRYLFSGVVTWWTAHKVAAAALGRGPLIHAPGIGAFITMALFPAAFFHTTSRQRRPAAAEPGPAAATDSVAAAASEPEERSWADRFQAVHEPAWRPLLRTVIKVSSAAAAAAAVIALRGRRLAAAGWASTAAANGVDAVAQPLWQVAAPAPAPFESMSSVLEHLAFMWIIYTSFSSVMDGPLALLQAARFTEWPGAGAGVSILPHFDAPWMSLSLRELWTRRWNISAGSILRQLVYEPVMDTLGKTRPLVLTPPHANANAHEGAHDHLDGDELEVGTAYHDGIGDSAREQPRASSDALRQHDFDNARSAAGESELRRRRPIGAPTPSAAVLSVAPSPSAQRKSQLSDAQAALQSAGSLSATRSASGASKLGGEVNKAVFSPALLRALASLSTFAVSGLCHEIIIAYCV